MKKFCLFVIAFLLFANAFSQHKKNIDATFTCFTRIKPDSTMDLEFTLYLSNSDGEFGDSLAIEFEEGVKPNNVYNDPFGPVTHNQHPENFNGVFDQLVSWGDNNNKTEMGGIETQTYYNFKINVSVDDTVTTRKFVKFFVSGDEMRYYPHGNPKDDMGQIYLEIFTGDPDLSVIFQKPVAEYYYTPKYQLSDTLPLVATVTNNSVTPVVDQAILLFDASSGGYFNSEQLPRPFHGDSSVTVKSKVAFKPQAGKTYNFKVMAKSQYDSDLSNNSDTCSFAVTDTVLARENGVMTDSVTLAGTGIIGAVYRLTKADTISSLSLYLVNPQPGDSLRLEIRTMALVPGDLIGFTKTLLFSDTTLNNPGWYTVPLLDTVVMPATSFFVGVNQLTANRLGLGVNPYNYALGTNYVLPDGAAAFEAAEPLGSQFANNYMLRVNTGKPWDLSTQTGTTGIARNEPVLSEMLYPNPCFGELNFPESLNNQDFSVMSITGKQVLKGRLKNGRLDVNELPQGIYLLRMANRNLKFVHN